jgi:hypothetical protein
MSPRFLRLMALVFAFGLIAAGCGDSDDSSSTDAAGDESGSTTTAAVAEATTTSSAEEVASTTTAGAEEPGTGAAPASMDEWEALWASERQAIIDDITANGYGVGDDNVLRGPAGFEVDLNNCPGDWSDTGGSPTPRSGSVTPRPSRATWPPTATSASAGAPCWTRSTPTVASTARTSRSSSRTTPTWPRRPSRPWTS